MDIRPAATLAITRDSNEGLQVLLMQRTWDATFMPGFYVFPGARWMRRTSAACLT